MTCFTFLIASLLSQAQPAASTMSPAETWQQVQDRYADADIVGFEAEGRILSTHPASAGRTIARISAAVQVARSGLGTVDLTIQTGQGNQGKTSRFASLGTAEGVFSLDCEQNLAYSCGTDWASSGELDDFAFLGSAWTGKAAHAGDPATVTFVPTQAEHPGLQGLRVQWSADQQHSTTAIFWLDQSGLVSAADVRLDAASVLHWNFRHCALGGPSASPMQAAALPAGCQREAGQPVEAVAAESEDSK